LILIDSTFVNSKGGLNVLNIFLKSIKKNNRKSFIIFLDKRNKKQDLEIDFFHSIIYVKNNLLLRQLSYNKLKNQIKAVITFSNVPLIVSKGTYQVTYLQQYLYLNRDQIKFGIFYLKLWFKAKIVGILFKYTKSDIAVQSKVMLELSRKIASKSSNIFLYPIFEFIPESNPNFSQTFICIGSDEKHKNLDFLLKAFSIHLKYNSKSKLYLTLNDKNKLNKKSQKILKNKNIINLGFLSRNEVLNKLKEIYYLVHPSLAESFGLVLAEAAMNGNPIIAPDLPYVMDVCNPSLVYENNNVTSLVNAFNLASNKALKPSTLISKSIPEKLIDHLINKL